MIVFLLSGNVIVVFTQSYVQYNELLCFPNLQKCSETEWGTSVLVQYVTVLLPLLLSRVWFPLDPSTLNIAKLIKDNPPPPSPHLQKEKKLSVINHSSLGQWKLDWRFQEIISHFHYCHWETFLKAPQNNYLRDNCTRAAQYDGNLISRYWLDGITCRIFANGGKDCCKECRSQRNKTEHNMKLCVSSQDIYAILHSSIRYCYDL